MSPPIWRHELAASRARRARKALAAYAALEARVRPQVEIEDQLLFATLSERARAAAAGVKRTTTRRVFRVDTQARRVLTADGSPVKGVTYDEVEKAVRVRWGHA